MFSTLTITKEIKLILNVIQFIIEVCGIYLFWLSLHIIAANLYAEFCAKLTVVGFIVSPFQSMMPHCAAMRWIISTSGNIITQMWLLFGTWITGKIFTNFFDDFANKINKYK